MGCWHWPFFGSQAFFWVLHPLDMPKKTMSKRDMVSISFVDLRQCTWEPAGAPWLSHWDLGIERDPPIAKILDSGVAPRLLELAQLMESPKLQFEQLGIICYTVRLGGLVDQLDGMPGSLPASRDGAANIFEWHNLFFCELVFHQQYVTYDCEELSIILNLDVDGSSWSFLIFPHPTHGPPKTAAAAAPPWPPYRSLPRCRCTRGRAHHAAMAPGSSGSSASQAVSPVAPGHWATGASPWLPAPGRNIATRGIRWTQWPRLRRWWKPWRRKRKLGMKMFQHVSTCFNICFYPVRYFPVL